MPYVISGLWFNKRVCTSAEIVKQSQYFCIQITFKKMANNLKKPKMANTHRSYKITDDNGCIFYSKYYIPEEILSIILSYVPPKDLVFSCRRVCKYWCNVVDTQVWRILFGRENLSVSKVRELPWFACYWIIKNNPFDRNLVKNGCGQGIIYCIYSCIFLIFPKKNS